MTGLTTDLTMLKKERKQGKALSKAGLKRGKAKLRRRLEAERAQLLANWGWTQAQIGHVLEISIESVFRRLKQIHESDPVRHATEQVDTLLDLASINIMEALVEGDRDISVKVLRGRGVLRDYHKHSGSVSMTDAELSQQLGRLLLAAVDGQAIEGEVVEGKEDNNCLIDIEAVQTALKQRLNKGETSGEQDNNVNCTKTGLEQPSGNASSERGDFLTDDASVALRANKEANGTNDDTGATGDVDDTGADNEKTPEPPAEDNRGATRPCPHAREEI